MIALFSAFLILSCIELDHADSNLEIFYSIVKMKFVLFHQDNPRFGYTVGIQYACNLLYKLCWSHLYKSLGALDLLLADELTRSGVMANYNILVDFLELKTVISHLRTGHTFFHTIFPSRQEEVMFLFFIGGFTTALMKQHYHFYLFDS